VIVHWKGQGLAPMIVSWHRRLRTIAVFLATLVLVWIVASIIHEAAHGLMAEIVGGKCLWISVWPGVQLYPRPGQRYEGEWGTSIAKTAYAIAEDWADWQDGLVLLAGSGVNLLLAALALGGLWLFRPRGWLRYPLMAETLMVEDILLYALLPELFGLRHYVIFGGSKPEPVNGAALLGCPRPVFVALIVAISALIMWALIAYIRRHRETAQTA
jgi:hypothetical protein